MVSYDQIGHGYARTRRADARIVEQIPSLLSLPPGGRVVDVGAGTGNYSNALAAAGYRVVAGEPSAAMRLQAVAPPSVFLGARFAEALPLRGGGGNAAVCILPFYHFTDARPTPRER